MRDQRVHAGSDEQDGVVEPGRYQRARRDALVTAVAEVVNESAAGLLGVHGGASFRVLATGKGPTGRVVNARHLRLTGGPFPVAGDKSGSGGQAAATGERDARAVAAAKMTPMTFITFTVGPESNRFDCFRHA